LCANGVILVSFLEKWYRLPLIFLGTFVFSRKTRIRIFENDTGGELKKLRFWAKNARMSPKCVLNAPPL
jgi:hypothetical protein